MYKPCFVLLISSLVPGPALAEDSPRQDQQQETEETSRLSTPAGKQVPKPAAPASSFTPSEEVSADSAVSFPVDI